jgi:hypothetical protein
MLIAGPIPRRSGRISSRFAMFCSGLFFVTVGAL